MEKCYWIIDTDAGVDDIQALVLGLSSPNIEIIAVTTVSGNVSVAQAVKNTSEALKICGRLDLPFYVGCNRPLVEPLVTAESIHGIDGLNGYWGRNVEEGLPMPQDKSAVEAILELSRKYAGHISIVTIGPLTNLAVAVSIDPELPYRFKEVVVMGGAVHGKGNITVTAEFNIAADPEASFIVFERFPLLKLVPWETCISKDHQFSHEFLEAYTSGTSKKGRFIKDVTKVENGTSNVFFCDPITIAIIIDPSIVTSSCLKEGVVELNGRNTRGMTVVNWGCSDEAHVNKGKRHQNLLIVEKLDVEKICRLLLGSIQ